MLHLFTRWYRLVLGCSAITQQAAQSIEQPSSDEITGVIERSQSGIACIGKKSELPGTVKRRRHTWWRAVRAMREKHPVFLRALLFGNRGALVSSPSRS
ncbi:MAG: hypothetical protein ACPGLY_07520 [Rubripirellula sp.]